MQPATFNTAGSWRRVRISHHLMVGLWLGAGPFLALDVLALGHLLGISAAFFLMLGYICTFIVVTMIYVFMPCPACGEPIRYRPGARGGGGLSIVCVHCGATPLSASG